MQSMNTTRSAAWIGGHDFRIDEQPRPEPGPGQIRVKVHACGVCMTEVHGIDGLLGERKPPRVLGHEFGGVIDALGPDVAGLEVGTAVACAGGPGFSEHVITTTDRVFVAPEGVDRDELCLVEPLVCCVAAVCNARLTPGATVLITGAGPMGLLLLQLARRSGVVRALVSEPNARRRDLAARLGADQTVDPTRGNLLDIVKDYTRGSGVDVAFETVGQATPLNDCLQAVCEAGTVVMVGVSPLTARLNLDLYPFHRRNLTLKGSYGGLGGTGFDGAVKWLGQLDLKPIVSHRFDLADIDKAFAVARNGEGSKVIVYPGRDHSFSD